MCGRYGHWQSVFRSRRPYLFNVMRYYQRTTRSCSFHDLRPELRTAIEQHAADNLFGEVAGQLVACIETESVQQKRSGLAGLRDRLLGPNDPDALHYTAVVVLP